MLKQKSGAHTSQTECSSRTESEERCQTASGKPSLKKPSRTPLQSLRIPVNTPRVGDETSIRVPAANFAEVHHVPRSDETSCTYPIAVPAQLQVPKNDNVSGARDSEISHVDLRKDFSVHVAPAIETF